MMPVRAAQASAPTARWIPAERHMAEARQATGPRQPRHCRHCAFGGCPGDCLLGDGLCIHGWNGRRPTALTWRVLLDRRWWHRVLWGEAASWGKGPRGH
jgi:hypothetical protein